MGVAIPLGLFEVTESGINFVFQYRKGALHRGRTNIRP